MINQETVLAVVKKLGFDVGPAVVNKKTKNAVVKITKEGFPVVSIVYDSTGTVSRIKGIQRLRQEIEEWLLAHKTSVEIYRSPNKAEVYIIPCGKPDKYLPTHRRGAPSEVNALLMEAFLEYVG